MKLTKDYFLTDNVLGIARNLLGKYLFTQVDGQLTGGIICEVEAYKGTADRASHAFGGRRTRRNEMMYHEGGVAYIYLCYGMHHLLNFVTNADGVPDAVLIRGIVPTHGEEQRESEPRRAHRPTEVKAKSTQPRATLWDKKKRKNTPRRGKSNIDHGIKHAVALTGRKKQTHP